MGEDAATVGRGVAAAEGSPTGRSGAEAADVALSDVPLNCGVVRLMRNFLAFGLVVIKPFRLFQRIEHMQLSIQQHGGGTGEFL